MTNSDETLQAFINKLLTLQGEQRDKPFSDAELKEIALDMGMSEQAWQASQQQAQDYYEEGEGHLKYRNWEDAVQELEQAVALRPNHVASNHALATAYYGLWAQDREEKYQVAAEKYADRALQLKPGYNPTLRLMSKLRAKAVSQRAGKKRKQVLLAGLAGLLLLIVGIFYYTAYNGVISKEEVVAKKWAQVENVYQRRADVVPQLVETVKSQTQIEQENLSQLIAAYEKAQALSINVEELNSGTLARYEQRQNALGEALQALRQEIRGNQDVSSSRAYRDLQVVIEGSENRISVERKRFNDAVAEYNAYIKRFPNNLLGFEPKAYFQMRKGADRAPALDFD